MKKKLIKKPFFNLFGCLLLRGKEASDEMQSVIAESSADMSKRDQSFVHSSRMAFSLIELSIVLIIIGLLIVGVMSGEKLIAASSLSKARALTTSSALGGTEDLAFWFETVDKKSFKADEIIDGTPVTTWYDINPQIVNKQILTQGTWYNRPAYNRKGINNLPVLKFFDTNVGTANYFNVDASLLVNQNFTMFLVVKPENDDINRKSPICSNNTSDNIWLNYDGQSVFYYGGGFAFGASYASSVPRIISSTFSKQDGTFLYVNGALLASGTAPFYRIPISSSTLRIGQCPGDTSYTYRGLIAEVAFFTRVLTAPERQEIEQYLSKKWGIKLAG